MPVPDWLTARPIAHRGLHDRDSGIPENSLAAARAAIEADYAIEIDVRPAGDGTIMVFHDDGLERLTGAPGRLAEALPEAIRELRLLGTGEAIPTLDELLDEVAGRTPLIIEIKSEEADAGDFAARVAERIASYRGPAALMSFDPAAVIEVARNAPVTPRGLISYRWNDEAARASHGPVTRCARRHLLPAIATRAEFIAYDARALPALAPQIARRLGLALLTWTVRSAEEKTRLARHVDQIVFEGFRP